jgi:hypothetical protein
MDFEYFNYRSQAGLRAYVEFVEGESWLRWRSALRVTFQSTYQVPYDVWQTVRDTVRPG